MLFHEALQCASTGPEQLISTRDCQQKVGQAFARLEHQ
jgi:hypothetical protein